MLIQLGFQIIGDQFSCTQQTTLNLQLKELYYLQLLAPSRNQFTTSCCYLVKTVAAACMEAFTVAKHIGYAMYHIHLAAAQPAELTGAGCHTMHHT